MSTIASSEIQQQTGGFIPPDDDPARGFGGGDDAYPRLLRRYRLGLGVWLCSIVMLFVSFSSAYVVRRGIPTYDAASGAYFTSWDTLHLPMVLLFANTLILIGASFTIEVARRTAREQVSKFPHRSKGGPRVWTALSLMLLAGFVLGQAFAWQQLRAQGELPATAVRIAFFYVLTGTHAIHAIIGLFLLLWVAVLGHVHRPASERYMSTDLTAWYLHSMTVLWVYLLLFLLLA